MSNSSHLATARRVIEDEAKALGTMAKGLGSSFDKAIDTILGAKGRVVVSGMGKSGHIARKIAATLASTGTPALFLHPAEASHGDLGMVTQHDVVIALSNSGEAPELAHLLSYTRRFSIPLIAITSRKDGTLASQSDICLSIPQLGEACGYGVVPTTSTTMCLALGDAIAIALMQARDFTPENFRDFHPGGKLGARLAKVADLMHSGDAVPIVGLRTPMTEALLTISQKGFGVVGVLDDDDSLIGIITDGDLRRNMEGLLDRSADGVMTKNPQTISPSALAETALAKMQDAKVTCLFVTDKNHSLKGILHIHDCLRTGVA